MILKPAIHRRGFLEGHVLPAVVVEREPQAQHRFVIGPLLGKTVVRRVHRRDDIRRLRLLRSMWLVQALANFGWPIIGS